MSQLGTILKLNLEAFSAHEALKGVAAHCGGCTLWISRIY